MVTVDAPFLGNREHDERNKYACPGLQCDPLRLQESCTGYESIQSGI